MRDVLGTYYFGDGLGVNCYFELKDDRRFSFTWRGCLGIYDTNEGPWSIEDGWVVLKPEKPNGRAGLGTATRFFPVQWGERLYLVADDDMERFCEDVPREWAWNRHGHPGWRIETYYLRIGDEAKRLDGSPRVPEPLWKIFGHPFRASVVSVKDDGRIVIDRGEDGGLARGVFLSLDGVPDSAYEVMYTHAKSAMCRLITHDKSTTVKVGARVTGFTGPVDEFRPEPYEEGDDQTESGNDNE